MAIKKAPLIFCYFLLLSFHLIGQKKVLHTIFTSEKITIDGKFDENIWQSAESAKDFVMIFPDNGKLVDQDRKSKVKIVYDNNAIYIAATLYDKEPQKILKELTTRDNFATADHFGVFLNGYNDGQQEFRFFVSSAGVQADGVYIEANGEDFTWDAIWDSSVTITDYGWNVEMKIPYAALRFSSEKIQKWGLNFYREIRSKREQYSWSHIDNKISNESTQAGILEGIENISTPTRLFLIPYASQYVYANSSQKTYGETRGGLDIKYGINDAFTLDAILIPDFGQTKFDNVELNLSAFEQQFTENRPFFTEGTDLFNKGGLFYSRRIGETPSITVANNETVLNTPSSIKLINALKISGRTKDGLGIGVLNAVSENTSVSILNNDTNSIRQDIISPLTNFNVLVLDQRFRKNSSVSFVNTNVTRNGSYRNANVSALVWDLNTRKNTYNLSGDFKYSYVNDPFNMLQKNGHVATLNLGETSGKFRYSIGGKYVSQDFDNNDLGINFQTHYQSYYANSSYRILNPNKTFNSFNTNLNFYSEFDNASGKMQSGNIYWNINSTNLINDYYGYGITAKPFDVVDFYEPRTEFQTRYVKIPKSIGTWFFYSSNYNKKFALDINPSGTIFNEKNRISYGIFISPRYRFNDRFSLIYSFNYAKLNNNTGFIDTDTDGTIVFARRNRATFTNTIQGKYSINNKMNINLNIRHYWSYADNHDILTLQNDGTFTPNTTYTTNMDSNLNRWNLDLNYSWWFAPGSQVTVLYRNYSSIFTRDFSHQFGDNFRDALDYQNLYHSISVSVRYFIDYNTLKTSKQNK